MATYLQGVTDYIPQIQPWAPDLNFYQNVLERKQQSYNEGWNKTNSMYNSILNSPMMREQNNLKRDKFFKDIQGQLKQMTTTDFSLEQNVAAAAQVFRPFYEDENIVKDIGFTRTYQDELQLAESYRKCLDDKCKGKYWSGGVRALNYKAQEFIDASDEQALRMSAPTYTPYVNFMEKATKAVKEAGLSMKYDTKQGGYIVTTKNGEALQQPLMNFLMSRFGDDPELQDYYKTSAYLMSKENPEKAMMMYQYAMSSPQASTEQLEAKAQEDYMMNNYNHAKENIAANKEREENRFMALVMKKQVLENQIKKSGIVPGSDEANNFIQLVRDIEEQDRVVNKINGYAESVRLADANINEAGISGASDHMLSVIASSMQMADMHNAAVTLSYQDYERTMKVDQFALESTKHAHSLELAHLNHQFKLEQLSFENSMDAASDRLQQLIDDGLVDPLSLQFYSGKQNGNLYDVIFGQEYQGPIPAWFPQSLSPGGAGYNPIIEGGMDFRSTLQRPDVMTPLEGEDPGTDMEMVLQNVLGSSEEAFRDFRDKSAKLAYGWKETGNSIKADINGEYIRTIFNMASDAAHPDSQAAQLELLHVGNVIQKSIIEYDKFVKKVGDEDRVKEMLYTAGKNVQTIANLDPATLERLRKFPSIYKNNASTANAEYFQSVVNNWQDIKNIIGNEDDMFKFITEGEGVWVAHPETGKDVLRSEIAPPLNEDEIVALQNKEHDIALAKSDANLQGVTYTGPELNKREKEWLNAIHYLENNGGYERNYAAGTEIPALKQFFSDNADLIAMAKISDKAFNSALELHNNGLDNAASETYQTYKASDSYVDRVIAKNLVKKVPGGMNTIATKEDIYNKIIQEGITYGGGLYDAIASRVRGSETWTIPETETELEFKMTSDNALKLMAYSEYSHKGHMPWSDNTNSDAIMALADNIGIINSKSGGKGAPDAGKSYFGYQNEFTTNKEDLQYIYNNRQYLDLVRDKNNLTVSIKPKYQDMVTGVKSFTFDLESVEVDDDRIASLSDLAGEKYDNIVKEFVSNFQKYESPYSNNALGGGQGSFTAPKMSFSMAPTRKDDNWYYGVEMIHDALKNVDAISGGNTELLQMFYQDNISGKQFEKADADVPFAAIKFSAIHGDINNSKITVTYSDAWLKEKGFNTGKKYAPVVNATQEYVVENSNSQLKKMSMPNMFQGMIPHKGDTYTETTLSDIGTFTYTNIGNGLINVTFDVPQFNPETGQYENAALQDQVISATGVDWEMQHKYFLDNLRNIGLYNAHNKQVYLDVAGVRSPQELMQQYEQ